MMLRANIVAPMIGIPTLSASGRAAERARDRQALHPHNRPNLLVRLRHDSALARKYDVIVDTISFARLLDADRTMSSAAGSGAAGTRAGSSGSTGDKDAGKKDKKRRVTHSCNVRLALPASPAAVSASLPPAG